MIFGLGPQELLVILIIVLCIYGSKRLPEIGKGIGQSIREFKKAKNMYKHSENPVGKWIDEEVEEKSPGDTHERNEGPVNDHEESADSGHNSHGERDVICKTISKLR